MLHRLSRPVRRREANYVTSVFYSVRMHVRAVSRFGFGPLVGLGGGDGVEAATAILSKTLAESVGSRNSN